MPDEIKKVSMYDPAANAFREVPMENAVLLLESALNLVSKNPEMEEKLLAMGFKVPEKVNEPEPEV